MKNLCRIVCWVSLTLGILLGLSEAQAITASPDSKQGPVMSASRQTDAEIWRRYAGLIESSRHAKLSFENPGRIQQLHFSDFSHVKEGAVLVELNQDGLQARQRELLSIIEQREAHLASTENRYLRIYTLYQNSEVSGQEFENAKYALDIAKANLQQAFSQLQQINIELEKSRIRAPFDGVVIARYVEKDELIQAYQTVIEMIQPDSVWARVVIPAQYRSTIENGATVSLLGSDVENRLNGQVLGINSVRDPHTRGIEVIIAVETTALPGTPVELEISTRIEKPGFWVPLSAVSSDYKGQPIIFLISSTGEITATPVHIITAQQQQLYIAGIESETIQFMADGVFTTDTAMRPSIGE